jgi:hypothetical protein
MRSAASDVLRAGFRRQTRLGERVTAGDAPGGGEPAPSMNPNGPGKTSSRRRLGPVVLAVVLAFGATAATGLSATRVAAIGCNDYQFGKYAYGPQGMYGYLNGHPNVTGCGDLYWAYGVWSPNAWTWLYLRGRQWTCGSPTFDQSAGPSWTNHITFDSYNEYYGACNPQGDTWGNANNQGHTYWSYYLNY